VTPARLKIRVAFPIIERFRSNTWYGSVLSTKSIGSSDASAYANRLYAILYPIPKKARFDTIMLRFSTAGDKARVGVYKANEDIFPSELVLDAGVVSFGANAKDIDLTLPRGYYFLSFLLNADALIYGSTDYITPIKDAVANSIGYWAERSYGALPSTYPSAAGYVPYLYGICLRFIQHL